METKQHGAEGLLGAAGLEHQVDRGADARELSRGIDSSSHEGADCQIRAEEGVETGAVFHLRRHAGDKRNQPEEGCSLESRATVRRR